MMGRAVKIVLVAGDSLFFAEQFLVERPMAATSDFESTNEATQELGGGQADFRKAPSAEAVGEKEFLGAFGEEHSPFHQSDEDGRFGVVGA